MKLRSYLLLVLLAACAVVPAAAQTYYVGRVPSGTATNVASANGYTLVRVQSAGGQDLALFADYGLSARRLASPGVPTVKLEPNSQMRVPENPQARVNQSTVGILDSLGRTDLASYYGARVWAGYTSQKAGKIIQLDDVQRLFALGSGTVAVIDTGIDARHPALSGVAVSGYDFTRDVVGGSELADIDQSTVGILDRKSTTVFRNTAAQLNQSTVGILDQSTVGILDGSKLPAAFGHGTMVAGLIHYVAPNARIMPLKAFRADGTGDLFDILRAIYYAVDNGAKVINMSFSLDSPSDELQAAITYANSKRVICIASAGNLGQKIVVYPAGLAAVEGIGSTDLSDKRSSFSNYGTEPVSLAAPGENLITAYPGNNYAGVSGTSFSTAIVSGAAALIVQIDHNTNQAQADAALTKAHPLWGQDLGAGRLDLILACLYALFH